MKKMENNRLIIAAVIAAMASACTKDSIVETEPVVENGNEPVEMEFMAYTTPHTKAFVSDYDSVNKMYPVFWNPGDSILMFDVNNEPGMSKLYNQADSSAATTTFKGLVTPSTTGYYAVYPWQKPSDGDAVGLLVRSANDLPDTLDLSWYGYKQKATPFSFDPEKTFMVAYTANDNTLDFKHVFSFIKLKVTFDCKWIEFKSNNEEDTIGAANLQIQMVEGIPTVTKTTQASKGPYYKNRITLTTTCDSLPAGTYLIAVLPGTLSKGFTLEFRPSAASQSYTKSTSKSVDLTRGNILNLGEFSYEDVTGISTGTWEGLGTEADPYKITTLEQWTLLAEMINGKYANYSKYRQSHFQLTENIDCGGKTIPCVGDEMDRAFEGTFDGDGHTISNYRPSTGDCVEALFGYVKSATIKNLTLKPAGFNCRYDGFSDISYSPLIGVSTLEVYMDDEPVTVSNCHVEPMSGISTYYISCDDMECYYGGLIAWIKGSVNFLRCSNSINVQLDATQGTFSTCAIGGIAGRIYRYYTTSEVCAFDRCRNTGSIILNSPDEAMAGGILGGDYDHYNNDVTIRVTNCENRGYISVRSNNTYDSEDKYAGGIVGQHDSDGRLANNDWLDPLFYNCLNTGEIYCSGQSSIYAGGIVGYCYDDDTDFYSCASCCLIHHNSTLDHSGAITGNPEGKYYNCFYVINTDQGAYATGLTGSTLNNDNVYNCKELDTVTDSIMNSYRGNIPTYLKGSTITKVVPDDTYDTTTQYATWSGSNSTLRINF